MPTSQSNSWSAQSPNACMCTYFVSVRANGTNERRQLPSNMLASKRTLHSNVIFA